MLWLDNGRDRGRKEISSSKNHNVSAGDRRQPGGLPEVVCRFLPGRIMQ